MIPRLLVIGFSAYLALLIAGAVLSIVVPATLGRVSLATAVGTVLACVTAAVALATFATRRRA